ncbi:MAG: crotonase/enoyl-CoA hydratase family protein [Solirubrobacterales bacterium]|nr:crotonase/enoyl-CoA hydratase family protein [Solirubrobacterales bacterium]
MAKVRYERTGAAAVLTIDREERRNAVDVETSELLLEGYRRFEADDEARALVLTGAGELAFCAGADLKALAEVDLSAAEATERLDERPDGPLGFTRIIPTKPTIAAISGWCLAGGLELALWCDLRIATETARLGFPERRWGVPLIDGGTQRLPRVVGLGRGLEMILTGRIIDAEEARAIGLANEVVGPGLHMERALEIAEGLATFPQETMLSDRRAALEGIGMTLAEGLSHEAEVGSKVIDVAIRGASRFADGEGRGGEGAGV